MTPAKNNPAITATIGMKTEALIFIVPGAGVEVEVTTAVLVDGRIMSSMLRNVLVVSYDNRV